MADLTASGSNPKVTWDDTDTSSTDWQLQSGAGPIVLSSAPPSSSFNDRFKWVTSGSHESYNDLKIVKDTPQLVFDHTSGDDYTLSSDGARLEILEGTDQICRFDYDATNLKGIIRKAANHLVVGADDNLELRPNWGGVTGADRFLDVYNGNSSELVVRVNTVVKVTEFFAGGAVASATVFASSGTNPDAILRVGNALSGGFRGVVEIERRASASNYPGVLKLRTQNGTWVYFWVFFDTGTSTYYFKWDDADPGAPADSNVGTTIASGGL